jgi:hypothetical protein
MSAGRSNRFCSEFLLKLQVTGDLLPMSETGILHELCTERLPFLLLKCDHCFKNAQGRPLVLTLKIPYFPAVAVIPAIEWQKEMTFVEQPKLS